MSKNVSWGNVSKTSLTPLKTRQDVPLQKRDNKSQKNAEMHILGNFARKVQQAHFQYFP